MCPNRTLSPPLLLMVTAASIVPSSRILICACPFDSDAQAGNSSSERICVLNTTGGTSPLCTLARNEALPSTPLVGVGSLHPATTSAARYAPQCRIRPPALSVAPKVGSGWLNLPPAARGVQERGGAAPGDVKHEERSP